MKEKTRVYIAGKISGLTKEESLNNFAKASEKFRQLGFTVFNPKEIIVDETLLYDVIMEICFIYLDNADLVYMMSNWKDSKGATLEHKRAKEKGKVIIYEKINHV